MEDRLSPQQSCLKPNPQKHPPGSNMHIAVHTVHVVIAHRHRNISSTHKQNGQTQYCTQKACTSPACCTDIANRRMIFAAGLRAQQSKQPVHLEYIKEQVAPVVHGLQLLIGLQHDQHRLCCYLQSRMSLKCARSDLAELRARGMLGILARSNGKQAQKYSTFYTNRS